MKIYNLKRKQILPIRLDEAWVFFSSPKNLSKITPSEMRFEILNSSSEDNIYAGQIICYKVNVIGTLSVRWVTEITHVTEPCYFVDEQRFGPYKFWHHQHHFKEVEAGVEIADEVNYALPYGLMGRLANYLFVDQQLNAIFDYRYKILDSFFINENSAVINEN